MKFKEYIKEVKSSSQIKREWKKWMNKRTNLMGNPSKSKEYKEARKKELELAHEYWLLTGFKFQGLGQMPFESIQESNIHQDLELLNGIRLAFDIKAGNDFFLSILKSNKLTDKQVDKAKEILKKSKFVKKLIRMAKQTSPEQAIIITIT